MKTHKDSQILLSPVPSKPTVPQWSQRPNTEVKANFPNFSNIFTLLAKPKQAGCQKPVMHLPVIYITFTLATLEPLTSVFTGLGLEGRKEKKQPKESIFKKESKNTNVQYFKISLDVSPGQLTSSLTDMAPKRVLLTSGKCDKKVIITKVY